MNKSGKVNVTNIKGKKPVAVTWGVFPGKKNQKSLVNKIVIIDYKNIIQF